MTKYYLCKIKPKSTFHLGTVGIGMEKSDVIIHSDTLFSGIANKYFELFDDGEEVFKSLDEEGINPIFVISSAFPYCQDILFLPKPRVKPNLIPQQQEDTQIGKKLKEIDFLSVRIFQNYVCGKEIEIKEDVIFDKFLMTQDEKIDIQNNKIDYIYRFVESSRNVLDRRTNQAEIFYVGEVETNREKNCGYYFFIQLFDDSLLSKLRACITLLGDDGIGGDRSCGKGQFEITFFEEYKGELLKTDADDKFVTLSLFLPRKTEIENGLLNNASYELIRRGGWIYSSKSRALRKRSLRMFTEGSCFKEVSSVSGKIIDVRPNGFPHPVYKNGLAFKVYIYTQ